MVGWFGRGDAAGRGFGCGLVGSGDRTGVRLGIDDADSDDGVGTREVADDVTLATGSTGALDVLADGVAADTSGVPTGVLGRVASITIETPPTPRSPLATRIARRRDRALRA